MALSEACQQSNGCGRIQFPLKFYGGIADYELWRNLRFPQLLTQGEVLLFSAFFCWGPSVRARNSLPLQVVPLRPARHPVRWWLAVGVAELKKKPDLSQGERPPIRQKGGGRKKPSLKDPEPLSDLERLLEPVTRGDPQSPLRWTCKSVRNLADELRTRGHPVSHMLVAELLHEQKYSLQANRKTKEGSSHPDRNAQFEHISAKATEFLNSGQPAISVDTKKKEQVGDYKNGGREWRPKGQPVHVQVHDFAKQKSCSLWRLRSGAKRGLGKRRHRSRHLGVRG